VAATVGDESDYPVNRVEACERALILRGAPCSHLTCAADYHQGAPQAYSVKRLCQKKADRTPATINLDRQLKSHFRAHGVVSMGSCHGKP
jgi:hypothetical protein